MIELPEVWVKVIKYGIPIWIVVSGAILAFYSLLKSSQPAIDDTLDKGDMIIMYRGEGPPDSP